MTQVQAAAEPLEEPIILPWNAVSSKVTSDEYLRKSRYFLEFGGFVDRELMNHRTGPHSRNVREEREELARGMKLFLSRSMEDPRFARTAVIKFIEAQKKRLEAKEIGANHLRNSLKPIRLGLEMNEVPLPWRKLMRLVPVSSRKGTDREYTVEEIQRLVSKAGMHIRVAILFMASCGMRVGAFEFLNVGDIKPVEQDGQLVCGLVRVYAGEGDDEYETLISKEAYLAFQEYLESRKTSEEINDNSPAIVLRELSKRCRSGTIRNSISWLLGEVGIRKEKKRRHEIQVDHGFRKFFDNVAKDYIDESYVEKLMGHSGGTKEHYDRHLPKPLIEQYLKAMPHLSVGAAYRAEAELSKKLREQEKDHSEGLTDMRLLLIEKGERMKDLESTVQELGEIIRKIQAEREKELATSRS